MNAFAFDFSARVRISGTHMNHYVVEELPLPVVGIVGTLRRPATVLDMSMTRFAPWWPHMLPGWREHWAITAHERLRVRCVLDALVATLYGLSREDLRWILRDCDQPKERLSEKAFCRTLDAKGFWRVGKAEDPELRHSVLTLVAFDALAALVTEHGGAREAAIAAFAALNGGEGWMLPETLRLADHGLGHDDRAKQAQPVASRLGPRFLDWQLAQTPEESWAECERHACAILGDAEFERRFGAGAKKAGPPRPAEEAKDRKAKRGTNQQKLFE